MKHINFDVIIAQLVNAGTLDANSSTLGLDLDSWMREQSPQSSMGKNGSKPNRFLSLARCNSLAKEYRYWTDYSPLQEIEQKKKRHIKFDQIIEQLVGAGTLDTNSATLGNDLFTWLKEQATPYANGSPGKSVMSLERCNILASDYRQRQALPFHTMKDLPLLAS